MDIVRRQEKHGRYTLSIQRSNFHYCTADTYKVAISTNARGIHVPEGMERFYSYDTVIGWVSEEKLQEIRTALQALVRNEQN